ncbi:hypothetical protein Purlil1_12318 [Purpureocillium lilacinum]|uniref:DUF7703 domain-containing protein n=1 Tax=Purpureocillium lilacinum TaxID=33203 RepID=A0ABR0BH55_PURLI|nr:hypothetical protein Purlil1_12318 [Purpureocillium lilacinum]
MTGGSSDGRPGEQQEYRPVVVFISVALYNVVELNLLIVSTFKRFLRHLRADPSGYVQATIILIGWCTMITGQSLVLYSRLHIVLYNLRRLHYVLIMIIVDAIWLGVPVIVLVYGTNSHNPKPFAQPYAIFEKLQLTVFFLQEVIISGLYIFETTKPLKLQHAWKSLVYSIKLKAEFSVLNRLVEFSQRRTHIAGTDWVGIRGSLGRGAMRQKQSAAQSAAKENGHDSLADKAFRGRRVPSGLPFGAGDIIRPWLVIEAERDQRHHMHAQLSIEVLRTAGQAQAA